MTIRRYRTYYSVTEDGSNIVADVYRAGDRRAVYVADARTGSTFRTNTLIRMPNRRWLIRGVGDYPSLTAAMTEILRRNRLACTCR